MLGGVIGLITFTALSLGLFVVAITTTAPMQACLPSTVITQEVGRIIRSAPCFLPLNYELKIVKKCFFKTQSRGS